MRAADRVPPPLTSRAFVAALAVAGPLAACAGCGGSGAGATDPGAAGIDPNALPDGVAREPGTGAVVVRLAAVPALARAGGALLVAPARVLVTRPTDGEFRAFDATCPHAGSLVARIEGTTLVCPAHQSAFDLGGALVRGPAERGLRALPVQHDAASGVVRVLPG